MSKTQEAIEKIVRARAIAKVAEPNKAGQQAIVQHLDEALAALQAQPCETCRDSGFIPQNQGHNTVVDIPCPDCQQPPAGEFVKELRNRINNPNNYIDHWHQKRDAMSLKACDRLDQQAKTIVALTQAREAQGQRIEELEARLKERGK